MFCSFMNQYQKFVFGLDKQDEQQNDLDDWKNLQRVYIMI